MTSFHRISLFLILVLLYLGPACFFKLKAQSHQGETPVVYLIPGQGSDHRIFKELDFPQNYEVRNIEYSIPEEDMTMANYARALSSQIDTQRSFSLIGVSLGGMLACEMSSFLNPERVIIISSAKSRYELPLRYRFQQELPFYRILSSEMSKQGALFMQPIVEPDRDLHKSTFVSMLQDKDPVFLKRTIAMIINWKREEAPENIVHIHGTNDHTIPYRNVNADVMIENGSHMMTLTRSEDVSRALNAFLTGLE